MIQDEKLLVKEVRNLFQSYKLKQCIQSVDTCDLNVSFECHQNLQLYKGQSLIELAQTYDGFQCFEDIIKESVMKKGGLINEIDVIIRIIYSFVLFFDDLPIAVENNKHLLKVCEEYRIQNENLEKYQKGIYLVGKGVYLFIRDLKNQQNFDCIPYLEEAFELVEDYKQEIMILLGGIFYSKSKLEESLKWYYMLYDLNKYYPGLVNYLALVENENKNFEKAEKLYKETESLCDNNPAKLHNISIYYQQIGKKEEEKEYIEKMYDLNPKSPYARCSYGRYLYNNDQKEEGLKMIINTINLDPKYIEPYQELLRIYCENQDYENVKIYAEKCLEIYPNNGFYHYRLGEYYEQIQYYQQAIQYYTKAEQLPNYPFYIVRSISRLAYCQLKLRKYDESLEQYFRSCNQIDHQYLDNNITDTCKLINKYTPITVNKKIELINKQEGQIIMTFEKFANKVEDQKLKCLFLERLDNLRTILYISSYKKYIQLELTFQALVTHFDLFID